MAARSATLSARSTLLAIASCLLLSCTSEWSPPGTTPSFLIVDIDTLRADRLGLYGNPRPTSPSIDAWSREATVFEWAFSQAPNTAPSQASILTGLYPSVHGRLTNAQAVPDSVQTLAERLRNAGYRTGAFVDGGFMAPGFGLEQGFDTYDNSQGGGLEAIGPKSLRWLLDSDERPFLLLIHTYDVHSPYAPKEAFRTLIAGGITPSTPGFEPTAEALEEIRLSRWKGKELQLNEGDLAYALALYDSEIRQMDAWFGSFLKELRTHRLIENTVVVLISDHGEEFQEHGSVHHEKLYSTVTHVPLIVALPNTRVGSRVDSIVETIDLAPTVLRLAGVERSTELQGSDLFLHHGRRRTAYGESPLFGSQRFLARGDWKAIYYMKHGKLELFRFKEDRLEQKDLSDTEVEVAGEIQAAIKSIEAANAQRARSSAPEASVDHATMEQLRALGYLN